MRLRVATELPGNALADSYVPSDDGNVAVNVPAPGHLAVLDRMYSEWTRLGPSLSRAHFPALQNAVWYRAPGDDEQNSFGRVVAWLRIGTAQSGSGLKSAAISGRRVSTLTALFKAAVLRQYQDLFGEPPQVLHGHGFGEKGYELARYLALPDVGFSWSRGRIHGLALVDAGRRGLAAAGESAGCGTGRTKSHRTRYRRSCSESRWGVSAMGCHRRDGRRNPVAGSRPFPRSTNVDDPWISMRYRGGADTPDCPSHWRSGMHAPRWFEAPRTWRRSRSTAPAGSECPIPTSSWFSRDPCTVQLRSVPVDNAGSDYACRLSRARTDG